MLNVEGFGADSGLVWIDRVISQSPEGPSSTDLHERLTVIASADAARRRAPYSRVHAALQAQPSTTLEVRTEYGDRVTAVRSGDGSSALFETTTKLPVHQEDRGLGIVGHLNAPQEMAKLLPLLHVTPASLRQRAVTDADLVTLARTPLDQLFDLASKISASEAVLTDAKSKRSDLSNSIREYEAEEESLAQRVDEHDEGQKKIQTVSIAAFAMVAAGVAVALVLNLPTVGAAICGGALIVAGVGYVWNRKASQNSVESEALGFQLGRVDQLFDTHTLTRSRRAAEESLAENVAEWRSIAGNAKPSALLTDRTRIEELASHLRLIDNENVEGDTTILIGFASLLAELNRRFPAERVPLLIDDLFPEVQPQYHGLLRELITRASHRRQVVLETGDITSAKWAAVEAVVGDALLISDFDIDVEPIISEAVAAEGQHNV